MRHAANPRSCSFALSFLVVAGFVPAIAELQNIVVNGFYSLPESERLVQVINLPQHQDGGVSNNVPEMESLVLTPFGYNNRGYSGGYKQVTIPERPRPKSYPNYGRVALFFYFGVPGWTDGSPRDGDLMVHINGQRMFSTSLTGSEWQPRLVSLRSGVGEYVDIDFWGAWMEGDPLPVVIALPRIVAWHGPYYQGSGGLSIIGPHGGRTVSNYYEPDLDWQWELSIDGTQVERSPLMVEVFHVYRPADLLLKSATYEYTASLREGSYWMPLPLPPVNEPGASVYALRGKVESGAVDIIPNFMADDAEYLRAIEAGLAVGSEGTQ